MAVEDYILKMRSLAHEFMLLRQQVSDDDLCGLGLEFQFVSVNLSARE